METVKIEDIVQIRSGCNAYKQIDDGEKDLYYHLGDYNVDTNSLKKEASTLSQATNYKNNYFVKTIMQTFSITECLTAYIHPLFTFPPMEFSNV